MLYELEQIGQTHILNEYKCKIAYYTESHTILGIRIRHPNIVSSTHYLYFVGVLYFEGPSAWTGADFVISSEQDSHDIWRRVFPDLSDRHIHQLFERFHVCTTQNSNTTVKIAYGSLSVSRDAPVSSN